MNVSHLRNIMMADRNVVQTAFFFPNRTFNDISEMCLFGVQLCLYDIDIVIIIHLPVSRF